jgi:hypothetical protein
MTTTRFLTGVLVVALGAAGPAAAQTRMPPYSAPGRSSGLAPSVLPPGADDPGLPTSRPPATAQTLERMTSPAGPGDQADSYGTLTGLPNPAAPTGPGGPTAPLPPGTYAAPYYFDAPGCCGPLGGGHLAYELYMMTGPNFIFGNGPLTDRLNTGWIVQGGNRTLFFNKANDAAWVLDLGLSYQYNRGKQEEPVDLFVRQAPQQNQQTGVVTPQPDLLLSTNIRGFHRTAFNFAVGRDWWFWGAGAPGLEHGWNFRFGMDVGGRWGTEHVDLDLLGTNSPFNTPLYARRQGVFHGVYISGHISWEVPVGGWIWFVGLRGQYGYDWGNVVMPLNGDIQNANLLMTTGIRF